MNAPGSAPRGLPVQHAGPPARCPAGGAWENKPGRGELEEANRRSRPLSAAAAQVGQHEPWLLLSSSMIVCVAWDISTWLPRAAAQIRAALMDGKACYTPPPGPRCRCGPIRPDRRDRRPPMARQGPLDSARTARPASRQRTPREEGIPLRHLVACGDGGATMGRRCRPGSGWVASRSAFDQPRRTPTSLNKKVTAPLGSPFMRRSRHASSAPPA